jgi:hypothetical protein
MFPVRPFPPQRRFRQSAAPRHAARRRVTLAAERLESRLALAGLVSVAVSGDVLTVTGDHDANAVGIRRGDRGLISVVALQQEPLVTAIRGPDGIVGVGTTLRTPIREIRVRMAGGDDAVEFGTLDEGGAPATTLGRFDVDLGDGNDSMTAGSVEVGGMVTIRAGGGNDEILLRGVRSFSSILVTAGDGDDLVGLLGSGALLDVCIDGGAGADRLVATNGVEVGRRLSLVGGAGKDQVLIASLVSVRGAMRLAGGLGDDEIMVADRVQVLGATTLVGGAHADRIGLAGSVAMDGGLAVAAGPGDDRVVVTGSVSTSRNVVIGMGTGEDRLDVRWGVGWGDAPLGASMLVRGDLVVAKPAGSLVASMELIAGSRVGRDVVIRSFATTSSVRVRGLEVERDLMVTTGMADDEVTITETEVSRHLRVQTGGGDDVAMLTTVQVGGDARIETGAGDDTVEMGNTIAWRRAMTRSGSAACACPPRRALSCSPAAAAARTACGWRCLPTVSSRRTRSSRP